MVKIVVWGWIGGYCEVPGAIKNLTSVFCDFKWSLNHDSIVCPVLRSGHYFFVMYPHILNHKRTLSRWLLVDFLSF